MAKYDFEDWDEVKPSQFAKLHGLKIGLVRKLCREGRIVGARQVFRYWHIPPKARIKWTDKEKIKRCLRALRCYGSIDMWHHGRGIPHRGKPYGHETKEAGGDGILYNAFGIIPEQDGWKLAEDTLIEIGEK